MIPSHADAPINGVADWLVRPDLRVARADAGLADLFDGIRTLVGSR